MAAGVRIVKHGRRLIYPVAREAYSVKVLSLISLDLVSDQNPNTCLAARVAKNSSPGFSTVQVVERAVVKIQYRGKRRLRDNRPGHSGQATISQITVFIVHQ
jgi:hypothetical protein